ncbi:MAG: serine hydrolase, partial [Acidobacteria bacterium]|nr:serine hydrolase [Acidobacteriota bacterium]
VTVHGFAGYSADSKPPTLVQILDGTEPANSKAIRIDGQPHKEFRYAGGGYVIMQELVEEVTGEPFPDFIQKKVFKKLGMKRSTYQQPLPKEFWSSAAVGHRTSGEKVKGRWHTYPEMTAAGLWTTPSDLARFAIEIQNSKAGRSNRILSVKTTVEMLSPQAGGWGLGPELQGEKESARFAHGGANEGYRCLLVAYADSGKGSVVMTNSDGGGALAAEIMRSVAKEYGWLDYLAKEKIVVPVESRVFDAYTGEYQLSPSLIISITNENGKLTAQATGQPKNEMFAESETEFFLKTVEVQIKFVKDAGGKVTGLILRQGRHETPAQKIN